VWTSVGKPAGCDAVTSMSAGIGENRVVRSTLLRIVCQSSDAKVQRATSRSSGRITAGDTDISMASRGCVAAMAEVSPDLFEDS